MNKEIQQKTNIPIKNNDDSENYTYAIEVDYDSEEVIFTGWLYKLKIPEPNTVNRSQNGRGTDFKRDIVEYIGNNCYILTRSNCFVKRFEYLTGKDYTEKFLPFIRTEQRQSNVMTSARVQPFCRKHNINIGCYNGFRVCPRNLTERNIALQMHKNHFCLIWKSDAISYNRATEELNLHFKVLDKCIYDNHFKRNIKYEYKPEKVQSQLTNKIV